MTVLIVPQKLALLSYLDSVPTSFFGKLLNKHGSFICRLM